MTHLGALSNPCHGSPVRVEAMSARRRALLTAPKASAPALHVATLLRDEGAVVESGRGYHHTAVKHRLVHTLQKYLLNPPIRLLLALQIVPPGYALLETVGRVTGKPRRTPVGNGLQGETFWIVSEHGQKAGYVGNIQHSARVRVRFRHGFRFRWRT